jgi:hypothetical protein
MTYNEFVDIHIKIFKSPNAQAIDELWQLSQLYEAITKKEWTIGLQYKIVDFWHTGVDKISEEIDQLIKQTLAECVCETLNFVRPYKHRVEPDPYYELLLEDTYFTVENLHHCVEIINVDPQAAYNFTKLYGPTSLDHYMTFPQWLEHGWQYVISKEAELPGLILVHENTWMLGYAQGKDDLSAFELL